MNKKRFIAFTAAFLISSFVFSQAVYCPDGTNLTPGTCSSQLGYQTHAKGNYSFATGWKSIAENSYSIAMGYQSTAFSQGASIGSNCYSKLQSFSFGHHAKANVDNSLAIGRYVQTNTLYSISIGSSSNSNFPLINNYPYSIIMGVNVNTPTFIIKGPTQPNTDPGKVGINTTNPIHPLHVDGNVMITGLNSSLLFADALSASGSWGKWGIEYETNGLNFWRPFENEKPVTTATEAKGGAQNYILFLKDDGNIGIGTNTPLEKLHVMGKSLFQAVGIGIDVPMSELHVVGRAIISENLTIGNLQRPGTLAVTGQAVFGSSVQIASLASEYEKMIVADKDGVLSVAEMPIGDQMGSHIASQYLQMRGFFITNEADEGNAEGIYVGASGNVGIKTSDISNDDDFTVSSAANKPNVSFLVKGHSNKPATAWIKNGNKKIGFGVDGSKGYIYEDYNNGISKVITFQDGRVGIGDLTSGSSEITMTGSHKLFVTGGITAEEVKVKVKTAWSDYVFYPDYQLKSLAEVETFIKQNGHLPEVPNAKTVEENGIELGEMNALLLRKIEELTLYILEQEKRIKALEEK